jgi:hypothetical protein
VLLRPARPSLPFYVHAARGAQTDSPLAAYLRLLLPLLPAAPSSVAAAWWLHWLLQLAALGRDYSG